ncbi:Transforming acidic coiled-coil-containing protein (TACC) [Nesidiocoris tenuis]|nr:Transforming acidic coiled-coil-containing protein (TACC) [Nesidiocoris tenuis]
MESRTRCPLSDVSNQTNPSSKAGGDKTDNPPDSVAADLKTSNSETGGNAISPACSTPVSSVDLDSTDDYASANEEPSSPERQLNLTVLANELDKLHLGTPRHPSDPSEFKFPYSPFQEEVLIDGSPVRNSDDANDNSANSAEDKTPTVRSPEESGKSENAGATPQDEPSGCSSPIFKTPQRIIPAKVVRQSLDESVDSVATNKTFFSIKDESFMSCYSETIGEKTFATPISVSVCASEKLPLGSMPLDESLLGKRLFPADDQLGGDLSANLDPEKMFLEASSIPGFDVTMCDQANSSDGDHHFPPVEESPDGRKRSSSYFINISSMAKRSRISDNGGEPNPSNVEMNASRITPVSPDEQNAEGENGANSLVEPRVLDGSQDVLNKSNASIQQKHTSSQLKNEEDPKRNLDELKSDTIIAGSADLSELQESQSKSVTTHDAKASPARIGPAESMPEPDDPSIHQFYDSSTKDDCMKTAEPVLTADDKADTANPESISSELEAPAEELIAPAAAEDLSISVSSLRIQGNESSDLEVTLPNEADATAGTESLVRSVTADDEIHVESDVSTCSVLNDTAICVHSKSVESIGGQIDKDTSKCVDSDNENNVLNTEVEFSEVEMPSVAEKIQLAPDVGHGEEISKCVSSENLAVPDYVASKSAVDASGVSPCESKVIAKPDLLTESLTQDSSNALEQQVGAPTLSDGLSRHAIPSPTDGSKIIPEQVSSRVLNTSSVDLIEGTPVVVLESTPSPTSASGTHDESRIVSACNSSEIANDVEPAEKSSQKSALEAGSASPKDSAAVIPEKPDGNPTRQASSANVPSSALNTSAANSSVSTPDVVLETKRSPTPGTPDDGLKIVAASAPSGTLKEVVSSTAAEPLQKSAREPGSASSDDGVSVIPEESDEKRFTQNASPADVSTNALNTSPAQLPVATQDVVPETTPLPTSADGSRIVCASNSSGIGATAEESLQESIPEPGAVSHDNVIAVARKSDEKSFTEPASLTNDSCNVLNTSAAHSVVGTPDAVPVPKPSPAAGNPDSEIVCSPVSSGTSADAEPSIATESLQKSTCEPASASPNDGVIPEKLDKSFTLPALADVSSMVSYTSAVHSVVETPDASIIATPDGSRIGSTSPDNPKAAEPSSQKSTCEPVMPQKSLLVDVEKLSTLQSSPADLVAETPDVVPETPDVVPKTAPSPTTPDDRSSILSSSTSPGSSKAVEQSNPAESSQKSTSGAVSPDAIAVIPQKSDENPNTDQAVCFKVEEISQELQNEQPAVNLKKTSFALNDFSPLEKTELPSKVKDEADESALDKFDISPKRTEVCSPVLQAAAARKSLGGGKLPAVTDTPLDSKSADPDLPLGIRRLSCRRLSEILATCSKQRAQLDGDESVDFNSCIRAEALKIAAEIDPLSAGSKNQVDQVVRESVKCVLDKRLCKQLPSCGTWLVGCLLSGTCLWSRPLHMMQSAFSTENNDTEAGPNTADEDFNKEELFVDPSTLDLDFFSQASAKQSAPSKLARQSLFRVFDPLVGQLLSPDVRPPAMAENQSSGEENSSTPPRKDNEEKLIPITPATVKKPSPDSRQGAGGHTPSLRQEISKLQELMLQQEQAHQEKADLVEELRKRIAELEAADPPETESIQKQLKAKEGEIAKLKKELNEQIISNRQLVQVMEEYEKTIAQLVTIKEEGKAQSEREKEAIAAERDAAVQHLSNMEVAFNDVHQKYERAKTVIETLHSNEKELKRSYENAMAALEHQKSVYQKFKQHASDKLQEANAELEKIHREYNGEMARMQAVSKKTELRCKSLEESLEHKMKELEEMTQICDELIGKVSGQGA